MQRFVWLIPVLACAPSVEDAEPSPQEPTGEDCPSDRCLEGSLGRATIGAWEERDGLCFSWTVENDETLYVNALTAQNDGHFHHSNWFWVPDTEYDLPDGPWDCAENDFTELMAAVLGGVLFAQSTQLDEETQQFLPGYAVRVPPRARIIAYAHMLNLTPEEQTSELRTRMTLLPESEVLGSLAPWRFNYGDLDIPAGETSEHRGDCEVRDWYETVADRPFDVRIHYILPHFHALGQGFDATIIGGPRNGTSILEVRDAWGHPFGHTFEEPVDLSDADGLSFACEHTNPTDADVGYGIGDQEMCVALVFAESDWMIDTAVRETSSREVVDGVHTRTGACTAIGAPFEP